MSDIYDMIVAAELAQAAQAGTRRGRGKSEATREQIVVSHEILSEIQPVSIRGLCYKLFTRGLIRDMGKSSTNGVSRNLVWARENGIIPWGWIVDETRDAERVSSWSNPGEIISAAVNGYRRDHWQDQPTWVEVWSEKGTIRGVLAPVLREYGVTLRVSHGYGSATSVYGVADETRVSDKPLVALYAGDWDPSGLQMSEVDLPRRLERYAGTATIKRVALTAGDVAPGTDLPSFDAATKTADTRHDWFVENYGDKCFELDALSPVVLRNRIEAEIIMLLDLDAWEHAISVEAAEVESMRDFHDRWKRTISGPANKYSDGGA